MVWQDVLWVLKFAWNLNCKRAFSVYKFQRKGVWRTWDKGSWRGFRNQGLTIWSFFINIVILLTPDGLVHVMLWHSFRLCWNLENERNLQPDWNIKGLLHFELHTFQGRISSDQKNSENKLNGSRRHILRRYSHLVHKTSYAMTWWSIGWLWPTFFQPRQTKRFAGKWHFDDRFTFRMIFHFGWHLKS
jgi:hypothetical protein